LSRFWGGGPAHFLGRKRGTSPDAKKNRPGEKWPAESGKKSLGAGGGGLGMGDGAPGGTMGAGRRRDSALLFQSQISPGWQGLWPPWGAHRGHFWGSQTPPRFPQGGGGGRVRADWPVSPPVGEPGKRGKGGGGGLKPAVEKKKNPEPSRKAENNLPPEGGGAAWVWVGNRRQRAPFK